jgi:HlyD family secretion protein
MRRWVIILIILIIIAVAGYAAYQGGLLSSVGLAPATPTPTATEGTADTGARSNAVASADGGVLNSVVADARVVPVREASLSLTNGGIVKEILVAEGDQVEAGQLLLRLDAAQQKVAVARATADVQRAQATLQQLLAGPREAEIQSAQAQVDAATARYEQLASASLPGGIAQAEAALAAAQAALAKVLEGPSEEQLIAARAEIRSAEAELQRAQRAYNEVRWRADVGATQESAALQLATIAYEAARARLADLESGPSQADIASANAQVRQSNSQLESLRSAMPQELAAAQADVQAAQAQLDLLLAGPRPEEIASAEADVASATAALQQALVSLADTELRAPFAGTVAELTVNVGEQSSPSAPLVRLADLSTWQIETEDLTELDIVGVNESTPVMLTFDAIPDLEMSGKVKYIRPLGTDNRGDIVYTVVIEPAQQDERLLWNMTAVAEFTIE